MQRITEAQQWEKDIAGQAEKARKLKEKSGIPDTTQLGDISGEALVKLLSSIRSPRSNNVVRALAAVGGLVVAGVGIYGFNALRRDPAVTEGASFLCQPSAVLAQAVSPDACVITVMSELPYTDTSQKNEVSGAVLYKIDASKSFVRKPVGAAVNTDAATLVVSVEAIPTDKYAQTIQSTQTPASDVSISGIYQGLSDAYKNNPDPRLIANCVVDNNAIIRAVRANSSLFEMEGFTADMIKSPSITTEEHMFTPYTNVIAPTTLSRNMVLKDALDTSSDLASIGRLVCPR